RLAERGVAGTAGDANYPWVQFTRANAYYRAGEYDAAVRLLGGISQAKSGWQAARGAAVQFVLALAERKRGQQDKARVALARGRAVLDRQCPKPERGWPFDNNWHNWLRARALLREAESLLGAEQ